MSREKCGVCLVVAVAAMGWFVAGVARAEGGGGVRWDRGSLRLIERGADYGRMARLGDGSVGCVYDARGRVCFRRSVDGGRTFGEAVVVAEDRACWLTNAFLLPLKNGELLYFWNERPRVAVEHEHKAVPPGLLKRPFLIRVARSADLGKSWSAAETVYSAGPSYQDGCWEPAAVQLADGEVQVYFANEFPYQKTTEQEISMVRSADGGRTWGKAERVGFRAGHRDGMPAPLVLKGGEIVVGVEDNGQNGDRFKISMLRTGDNWRSGAVTADHPGREGALAEALPRDVYAGAPFLARLPDGRVLMSCQESEDGSLAMSRMAVYVGDASARGFGRRSYPLPGSKKGDGGQLWNSLYVREDGTVTAILTATVGGVRGVWAVDGVVTAD